jgi:protein N-terminal methyltransferase
MSSFDSLSDMASRGAAASEGSPPGGAPTLTFEQLNSILTSRIGKIKGTSSNDDKFSSITALWKQELRPSETNPGKLEWYNKAFNYWESEENCPISDDGVLGGYGALTPIDVQGSNAFLDQVLILRPELRCERAADCGAGIGRVTKNFLINRFANVDLIEQSPRLLASAAKYLGEESLYKTKFIVEGLQDFAPAPNTYDVIWIQWVIGHLHDLDFISFFRRIAKGLTPNGVIILKDNCCTNYSFVLDCEDRSVSRRKDYMTVLLEMSGMHILKAEKQAGFPEELYPVMMFAMCPIPPA